MEDGQDIDVDELAARITGAHSDASLEDLLIVAEARAGIRTALPGRLAFTPFAQPLLRRAILGLLAFASRDQRRINVALIAALRASAATQRALEERVCALETRAPSASSER